MGITKSAHMYLFLCSNSTLGVDSMHSIVQPILCMTEVEDVSMLHRFYYVELGAS